MELDAEQLKGSAGTFLGSLRDLLSEHTGKILVAVLLVSLVFYLSEYVMPLFLMILIAVVSLMTARLELSKLGIEVTTFSTVAMGVVFGPETGAMLGLLFILVELFTGTAPGVYVLWVIPGYVAAGYLAGVFSGAEIVMLGTAISAGVQSFFLLCTALLMRQKVPKYFQFTVFNVTFNALLFMAVGKEALGLMTAVA